jgi:hypothetical protein
MSIDKGPIADYFRKRALCAKHEAENGPSPEYKALVITAFRALSAEDQSTALAALRDVEASYSYIQGEEDGRIKPSRLLLQHLPDHPIRNGELKKIASTVRPLLARSSVEFYEAVHLLHAHGYIEFSRQDATYKLTAAGVAARDVDQGKI